MGLETSKCYTELQIPRQFKPSIYQPGIFQSVLDGKRLKEHHIQLKSEQSVQYERQIFIFRRVFAEKLVTARFFQNYMPTNICGGSYKLCFFTQYLTVDFSKNLCLPIQKGIYLLIQCLEGMHILYNKFGPFVITPSMIFLTPNKKVKVWISSNAAETKIDTLNKNRKDITQEYMVTEIFRIFDWSKEQNENYTSYSSFLKKMMSSKQQITFKDIINYMYQIVSRYFVRRIKMNQNNKMKKQRTNQNTAESSHSKISLRNKNTINKYTLSNKSQKNQIINSEIILQQPIIIRNIENNLQKGKKTKRYNSLDQQALNESKKFQLRKGSMTSQNIKNNSINHINSQNMVNLNVISSQAQLNRSNRKSADDSMMPAVLMIPVNQNKKCIFEHEKKCQKMSKITVKRSSTPQSVQSFKNSTTQRFKNTIEQYNNSNFLINIQTVKSIVNSDFGMDSAIKRDVLAYQADKQEI